MRLRDFDIGMERMTGHLSIMDAADFKPWEIPNVATFANGPGGLVELRIQASLASAVIYVQGAHVAEFQPTGAQPVLFMSRKSQFAPGKPIRGGVPLIFPWFGPLVGFPHLPAHGFARTSDWEIESLIGDAYSKVEVTFKLVSSDATRAVWPHDFVLRHRIVIGDSLSMTLEVENTSDMEFQFEEAFHTYFSVGDIHQCRIEGLAGENFIDNLDGKKRKVQPAEPLRFIAETENVYLDTTATCEIIDPKLARRIVVNKSGSATTVVWNPWIEKSAVMKDMGNDEWKTMVCIETANVGENRVTLNVGEVHRLSAEIFITDLSELR